MFTIMISQMRKLRRKGFRKLSQVSKWQSPKSRSVWLPSPELGWPQHHVGRNYQHQELGRKSCDWNQGSLAPECVPLTTGHTLPGGWPGPCGRRTPWGNIQDLFCWVLDWELTGNTGITDPWLWGKPEVVVRPGPHPLHSCHSFPFHPRHITHLP